MGPFLGRRIQTNRLESVRTIHERLTQWYENLPKYLWLETFKTLVNTSNGPMFERIQMQALGIQLSYDNMQIVLHRYVVCNDGDTPHIDEDQRQLSTQQLLESALRTSKICQYDQILQTCQCTHAAMYLGLCLFTAGVVLCAIALLNPLSSKGQDAKMGIMRIVQIHRRVNATSHIFTMQSIKILEELIHVIVNAEGDYMLGSGTSLTFTPSTSSPETLSNSRDTTYPAIDNTFLSNVVASQSSHDSVLFGEGTIASLNI